MAKSKASKYQLAQDCMGETGQAVGTGVLREPAIWFGYMACLEAHRLAEKHGPSGERGGRMMVLRDQGLWSLASSLRYSSRIFVRSVNARIYVRDTDEPSTTCMQSRTTTACNCFVSNAWHGSPLAGDIFGVRKWTAGAKTNRLVRQSFAGPL